MFYTGMLLYLFKNVKEYGLFKKFFCTNVVGTNTIFLLLLLRTKIKYGRCQLNFCLLFFFQILNFNRNSNFNSYAETGNFDHNTFHPY
jgi:hypothetical protein